MIVDEARLVATYRPRVVYFALRRLPDRGLAEEVAQETLAEVIQALKKNRLRDESKLPAFIFAVAKNLIHKVYRERFQEAEVFSNLEFRPSPSWISDPEAGLLLEEQRKEVRRALAQMRSSEREILRLSFDEGQSLEEIAKGLRITYAAARKRKSRALERLKKIWLKLSQKKTP